MRKFCKKVGSALMETLGELVLTVLFFFIGVGVLALLGNPDAMENMDSDRILLLGSLVVLAGFGIVFAVAAAVRKMKKRHEP